MIAKGEHRPDVLPADLHDEYLLVGRIVKPHGIKGELKVYPFSQQPAAFAVYEQVVIDDPEGVAPRHCRIERQRPMDKLVIVQCAGVGTRAEAEALTGRGIWVRRADLLELPEDEYYWHELEGMAVRTEEGRELGMVASLFSTGAHDIMVVKGQGREYLIPVTAEIIVEQDVAARCMVIRPTPGLLEIND